MDKCIQQIDEQERLTETQRINTIRQHLQDKAQDGLIGMIAARSRIPEYQLRDWCVDPAKVPTYGELIDLQDALGLTVILEGTDHEEKASEQMGEAWDSCKSCNND